MIQLIGETAWHHDGDFNFMKELVQTIAKDTKADYIKLHLTLDIDEYMHNDHPGYEWAKKRMFSENQWDSIIQIVKQSGKKPMFLFNDTKAVDFGMKYRPDIVEIHSVCLNDSHLLSYLKECLLPETRIVLGVGGTDVYEIENAVNTINSDNIVLMHGFQNYPTKYEDINFRKVQKLMQLYPNYEHGYADHTAWDNPHNEIITLLGAGLGMDYAEKHLTTVPGEDRTDWQAAISIELFNSISVKLKVVEKALGDGNLALNDGEKSYSVFGPNKKAAILNRQVQKGEELSAELYSFKRTSQTTDISQIEALNMRGKIFKESYSEGHCIKKYDFE